MLGDFQYLSPLNESLIEKRKKKRKKKGKKEREKSPNRMTEVMGNQMNGSPQ